MVRLLQKKKKDVNGAKLEGEYSEWSSSSMLRKSNRENQNQNSATDLRLPPTF